MPQFYFNLKIGRRLDEDVFGVDLPELGAVRREAAMAVANMVRDAAMSGTALRGEAFEIVDRDGRAVLTVPFDALPHRGRAEGMDA